MIELAEILVQLRLHEKQLFHIHDWSSLTCWREERFADLREKVKSNLGL